MIASRPFFQVSSGASLSAGLLAAVFCCWQILKGLALQPHIYGLLPYLYTYADGPVRRGLLPSLLQAVLGPDLNKIAEGLVGLHLLALLVLATVLAGGVIHRRGIRRWLLLLLVASAIIPVLTVTNGYADSLTALALVSMAALLRSRRPGAATVVFALAFLQHELVLVPGAALFLAAAVLDPPVCRRALAMLALVLSGASLYLAVAHGLTPGLVGLAATRCQLWQPQDEIFRLVWQDYCLRYPAVAITGDFNWLRGLLLVLYLPVSGLFALVLLAVSLPQLAADHSRRRWFLPVLMALPFSLVLVMWDADRVFALALLTGWLILDRWLEVAPPTIITSVGLRGLAAGLMVFQLALHYPAIDNYGYQRVLPPTVARAMLIDPRAWVLPWLALMQQPAPQALARETCVDLRCRD